jgi:hypothetical protein
MKIRAGFVSNSSSSSFCIYGAWVSADSVKKLLSDEDLKYIEEECEGETWGISEVGHSIPLFYHCETEDYRDEDECCAFGRSYQSIGDDETGKQFKESVEKRLKEIFGEDIKCHTINHDYRC